MEGMPCGERPLCVGRREILRVVGGWVIYGAAVGVGVSCGHPPQPGSDGPTPTPEPSASPTPLDCGCSDGNVGSSTGVLSSMIPVDGVAYNAARNLFLCRDASGYYAMTSLCTHSGTDIGAAAQGSAWQPADLAYGFHCPTHGSVFDANGTPTQGPSGEPASVISPLRHFRMSIDGSDAIWVDITPPFADPSCRC